MFKVGDIFYNTLAKSGSFTPKDRFRIDGISKEDGEFYYRTIWLTKPEGNKTAFVLWYESCWKTLRLVNDIQLEFNFD